MGRYNVAKRARARKKERLATDNSRLAHGWKTPLCSRLGGWEVQKSSLETVISACESTQLTISTLDPGLVRIHGRTRNGRLMVSREDVDTKQRRHENSEALTAGAWEEDSIALPNVDETIGFRKSPYTAKSFNIFSLDNWLRKAALRLCTHAPPLVAKEQTHLRTLEMKEKTLQDLEGMKASGVHLQPYEEHHLNAAPVIRRELAILRGERYYGEYFDNVVLLLIVVNTIFLAMDNPSADHHDERLFNVSEMFFNSIFTVEMVVKWFAMGVVSFNDEEIAFMSEPWNQLDFIVVIIGWLPQIVTLFASGFSANFTAIRTLRVLKVLKTFQRVKGMQKIVLSLFSCWDILVNVLQLMLFMYFVFAIIGVELFVGGLRRRCVSFEGDGHVMDQYCGSSWAPCTCNTEYNEGGASDIGGYQCPSREEYGYDLVCSYRDPRTRREGHSKMEYFRNPGELSFDNVGIGFLTVLTCASLEGWVDIMYQYMDSYGPRITVYFVVMIFLLAFFVLNLVIAVIYEAFTSYGGLDGIVRGTITLQLDNRVWRAAMEEEQQDGANGVGNGPAPHEDLRIIHIPTWRDGTEYCHPSRAMSGALDTCRLYLAKLRDICSIIVERSEFNYLVNILIVANTALLATEHEGQSCTFTVALCGMNVFFTFAFAIEMVIKLLGIGLRNYLMDGFNIFDGTIVLFSVSEVLAAPICARDMLCVVSTKVTSGKSVQVLRALRLLRVTRAIKMVKRWKSMSLIVSAIAESASGLRNFCCLLLLFMIIYALLGMQLFANKEPLNEEFYNFNTLYKSLLTVFVVTTGENWNDTLYATMLVQPYLGAVYTASMYILGNYIVVNIFLAILLNNFDQAGSCGGDDEGNLYAELSKTNEATKFAKLIASMCSQCASFVMGRARRHGTHEASANERPIDDDDDDDDDDDNDMSSLGSPTPERLTNGKSYLTMDTETFVSEVVDVIEAKIGVGLYKRGPGGSKIFYNCFRAVDLIDCLVDEDLATDLQNALQIADRLVELQLIDRKFPLLSTADTFEMRFEDDSSLYSFADTSRHRLFLLGVDDGGAMKDGERTSKTEELAKKREHMAEGKAFGMSGRHPLRRNLIILVTHPWFDRIVLFLIILSSLALAADMPQKETDPKTFLNKVLDHGDMVMSALFFMEMTSKILAIGFIGDKRCYMHDPWNILDFIIVCISLVMLAFKLFWPNASNLTWLKSLRIARVLRPLRMINRYPGMKMVVNALFTAMPEVANVGLVSLGFFIGFGIMGLALFRGQLQYCEGGDDDRYLSKDDCTGQFDVNGKTFDRAWVTSSSNFDNIGSSLLTLFEMATLEGWPGMMQGGMEASPIGRTPHSQPVNALFYVAFIVVGAFLVINLFVGVVVNKFQEAKASQDDPTKSLFLTDEQQRWRDEMVSILQYKVPHVMQEPETLRTIRMPFFILVQHKAFEKFIMVVIVLNVGVISLGHWNSGENYEFPSQVLNLCFTIIFALEMFLKIIGLSLKQYLQSKWNQFDFLIVLLSFVDLQLPGEEEGILNEFLKVPINMSLFRVLRVARIAKLIKSSVGLKALMSTMVKSLPAIANVGSLLGLLFFIYAVMGMNLFGSYIDTDDDGRSGERREFRKDESYLHKYSNFDTFPIAMLTLFRSLTGEDWNGIMHVFLAEGSQMAVFYFLTFTLISNFILLNLVVAVILENFADFMDPGDPTETGKESDHVLMNKFREGWLEVDTKTELVIPDFMIVKLLYALEPPLGFKGLREPIFHPVKGNFEQLLKHTQFMVDYVRELNIYTTSDGNMHYLDVLAAFLQRENGTSVNLASLEEQVLLSLATSLKTQVKSNMRLESSGGKASPCKRCYFGMRSCLQRICGGDKDFDEEEEVHRPLDVTAMTNAAVLFGTRWRARKMRRRQIALWREQGIWTDRLDHLVEVTIPELQAKFAREQKDQIRRSSSRPNTPQLAAKHPDEHDYMEDEETKEPMESKVQTAVL